MTPVTHPRAGDAYENALGPRASRYFGDGFKNVGHALTDLVIARSTEPGSRHRATARLDYPVHWSTKGAHELVPHVSSVDTLVLAATLLEVVLAHTRDLGTDEIGRMWVSYARVSAGAQPEENLDAVAVSVEIADVTAVVMGEVCTTANFRVGQLRGRMSVTHPVGSGVIDLPGVDRLPDLDRLYGPGHRHFYLDGYKSHTLFARDVTVDLERLSIGGPHHVCILTPAALVGAESRYVGSTSIIDAVVGAAQLSQILLYALDNVPRESSSTLWMRKLELRTESPHRPADTEFDAAAAVARSSTIRRGGETWRSADISVTAFNGVTGSCLLAHRLPEAGPAHGLPDMSK